MGEEGAEARWAAHVPRATVEDAADVGAVPLPLAVVRAALRSPAFAWGNVRARGYVAYLWALEPADAAPAVAPPAAPAAATPGGVADALPAPRRVYVFPLDVARSRAPDAAPLAPTAWADAVPVLQTVRGRGRRPGTGARWWWTCPYCARHRGVLYVVLPRPRPDGTRSAERALCCRVCLGFAYEVQRLDTVDRATWATDKVAARLAARCPPGAPDPDPWWCIYPDRPPGMWRATYARLRDALDAAQRRRERCLEAVLDRLEARLERFAVE